RPGRPSGRLPRPDPVTTRWDEAVGALGAADPALGRAMAELGPCTLVRQRTAGGSFGALARAICYQQLAGAAASAIHGRFVALYGGKPTPTTVLATPPEVLRATGLSAAKAASIGDLAVKARDGTVRLDGWSRMGDAEIVERLCAVWGIGPWTAHMFLMFQLNRPDVWPTGDFGVRAGYARIHGLPVAPAPAELVDLGAVYRPYRTVAAWYCWRAVDAPPPAGVSTTTEAW
ncbi:MAG: DNA-3-methyladenine glycosylase 2 family protein, partial [Acidimicrobiales bacterium]